MDSQVNKRFSEEFQLGGFTAFQLSYRGILGGFKGVSWCTREFQTGFRGFKGASQGLMGAPGVAQRVFESIQGFKGDPGRLERSHLHSVTYMSSG